ncbi:2-oxo-4-hydroxy-4-carboxy-5-ureidoimidazoline decarboxylase [Methylobacterium goesingense]|uniref:2-oxo-4-hydroxy-4-carboxy-5-ureidoimidazoline decarboxylase n=1 Tax=Methylobacterium goesingense TaxID=243690 RepID=A0ABV2LBG8_9HYPH|nr:2-oxo-4-hydroxy-4-carboxy-5-ureidoimidazoline decarboxylase [Methylobacterium goesingense]
MSQHRTGASVSGQESAGFDRISPTEFDHLNAAHRARFGFPSIIAARGSGRAEILWEFERRLAPSPGAEPDAALAEIAAITGSAGAPLGPDPRPPRRQAGHASDLLLPDADLLRPLTHRTSARPMKIALLCNLSHLLREENVETRKDKNPYERVTSQQNHLSC